MLSDCYFRYVMNLIVGMDKYLFLFFYVGELLCYGLCVMLNYGDYGMDFDMGIVLRCFVWLKELIEWIFRR